MSDNSISVRADDEIKEKFEQLALESGIGKKEFMRTLVETYEVHKR